MWNKDILSEMFSEVKESKELKDKNGRGKNQGKENEQYV